MEDSDNDSGLDDPVVRMRRPKNCTDVLLILVAIIVFDDCDSHFLSIFPSVYIC